MSKPNQFQPPTSNKRKKLSVQHVAIWAIMTFVLFFVFQLKVIPWGASKFVLPLFQPTGEQQMKMGFVKFDGLVWASTSLEKKNQLEGTQIKKDAINKEFIFDFTYNNRTDEENGYIKSSTEFFCKADKLGEAPIYIEPWVGFTIISFLLAIVIALLVTVFMPTSAGLAALLFDRQIDETKIKIRLQTGFSDDIVEFLTMPDNKVVDLDRDAIRPMLRKIWDRTTSESDSVAKHAITFEDSYDDSIDIIMFRHLLIQRIKEIFSDFLVKEIEDTKSGIVWRANHFQLGKGLRLYMAHHFTEKYSNNVTGLAYGGASVLIISVGLRGLKFIPGSRPSIILFATFLEFSMLALMAVTLFYTEEEERMDKMLKKMEDANRSQLDVLRDQQGDMHQLAEALVGTTAEVIKTKVEKAVSEFLTSEDAIKQEIAETVLRNIEVSFKPETLRKK